MHRDQIVKEIKYICDQITNINQTIHDYIDACGDTNINWAILDSLYTDMLNNYVIQGMALQAQLAALK
jgi:hypothetical protein